jgi:hypothetical protein
MLSLYEGSSVTNGYLVDAAANGGSVTDIPSEIKPTIFNGAVYYDRLPASLSVTDYYKNLEYSLQSGPSTLGYLGCDTELGTGYLDSIGSYGVMFDVISLVDQGSDDEVAPMTMYAEIYGMDLYIRNMVETSFEVYVRSNGGSDYTSYYEQSGQTSINENWTLIAKGSVVGMGPDVGTPIPAEAWLKNLVLKPGDSIGFYVTVLDEPHLRYRKSDLAEGAIFAEDGNLAIGVGRSWGQYPLAGDGSDTFFANREFSGAFRYHAHEGICQTPPPTPAVTTLAPVAPPDGLCSGSTSLKSTFQDGTGSFGALFDVVGKVSEVTLRGIDLNVSIGYNTGDNLYLNRLFSDTSHFFTQIDWNDSDSADVTVYAKKGTWFGFQNDKDSWPHVLVNTTIYKPADFPNRDVTGPYISIEHKMRSAIIPDWAFTPLTIKEGETWAFYVLTSVPDLRYTMGTTIGEVFASSPEIDILQGAGAADFPAFGSGLPEYGNVEYTFYAPRVFNGNLRYDYFAECPSEAPSISIPPTPTPIVKTSVTYMFYVEHGPSIVASDVPQDMERGVRTVLDAFLVDKKNDLHELVLDDGFYISDISAGVVPPADLGYLCVPTPPNLCTPIGVEVESSHLATASTEQVAYYLYRQASILPSLINVNGYKIVYVGKNAVETNNEITLSGVPGREMGDSEQEFFAKALQEFLNSQVTVDPTDEDALKIVAVSVNGQVIESKTTIARDGQRRLQNSNRINVQVKGQYRPPPEIDFGAIVEDSINSDPDRMARELKSPRPELQGTAGEVSITSDYFQEADVIGSKEIKTVPTTIILEDTTNPRKGTLNMMAGVVGALIMGLAAAFFLRPHRRAAMFGSKQNYDAQLHTQLVDREQGFVDEKVVYRDQYQDNGYQY